jgi:carbonic anhydrase
MKQKLIICKTSEQFNFAKKLTKDYMTWLGEDLCYQGIDKELETFHEMYNSPSGAFIYVTIDNEIAGGVGVRKLADGICEMKRLFVYEKHRGLQLGQLMCEELLKISTNLGYKKMRLDTLPKLKKAVKLYKNLGFYKITKYYNNPDERVSYMEIIL